jgi:dipeptidyl aminopeptidase/acylaminoacyl peptidase
MCPKTMRLSALIAILPALACLAPAADDPNLTRDTPVPAGEQIPLVDFFRPPVLQRPAINQAGTHIAAIVADGDTHLLLVYDMKTQSKEFASGGAGDKDIDGFAWLNDTKLVYTISTRKLWNLGIFAADVGAIASGYPLVQYYGSELFSIPLHDRLHPLVWNRVDSFHGDGKDLGVSVLNTDNLGGTAVNLAAAGASKVEMDQARDNNVKHLDSTFPLPRGGITTGYMTDKEGKLQFAYTSDHGRPKMYRLDGDHWVECPVDVEHTSIFGAGPEEGQVIATAPLNGKPRSLQFLNAATGQWGDALETEKAYDFNGWLYGDPVTRDPIGAFTNREYPRVIWFTDVYSNLQKILNGMFKGQFVQILGSNDAQSIFLVSSYSDRQPAIYSWVDLEKKTAGLFKKSMPWIDAGRMRPTEVMKYKTRDGHSMDAYLTLPAGASKEHPAPLVVIPHGGPWVRETWHFDGEAQFLASRGYAVLKPNYRGSPGYNWMFPEEDEWDFLKMHYDVTDATKAALALGVVDPGRVAIMGGSFGGYLALQGAVLDPDLYRCAVTIAGVFDWEKLIADEKWNFEHSASDPEFERLMYKLGDPKKFPEKFDKIAPVRHVDQIRVPIFVNHGGYDPIADITQSTDLISELEKHHVTYEKLIVTEETHGMAHLSNQVDLYSRIEAFLGRYLGPASAPAGH